MDKFKRILSIPQEGFRAGVLKKFSLTDEENEAEELLFVYDVDHNIQYKTKIINVFVAKTYGEYFFQPTSWEMIYITIQNKELLVTADGGSRAVLVKDVLYR